MTELFTRRDPAYFARTLGINNLQAYFVKLEKELASQLGTDSADVTERVAEVQDILSTDEVFRQLVEQRSRAYARESQIRETGQATAFPDRKPPQVAAYSIRKTYGHLLDLFEQAFQRKNPLGSGLHRRSFASPPGPSFVASQPHLGLPSRLDCRGLSEQITAIRARRPISQEKAGRRRPAFHLVPRRWRMPSTTRRD